MLEVQQVSHSFDGEPVLQDIHFSIPLGTFVSLIGPSGCGKSTIFHILMGLVDPVEGEIRYQSRKVDQENYPFAYMPQKDTLFPWKTVLENAMLPARMQGKSPEVARKEARSFLDRLGLHGVENQLPYTLSGGMRQRINLLRTYLFNKEILLLDEPFASLDAITRAKMQHWLMDIGEHQQKTILFITHDIEEAIFLSDQIIVLSPKPAQIVDVHTVPFSRPRTRDMLTTSTYVQLKQTLYRQLL